ncbi:MAG: hypothetical protein GQ542_14010 [Desulforhopalus sp.]|nr:hypothetical protein [Desulforhopalus sp.]
MGTGASGAGVDWSNSIVIQYLGGAALCIALVIILVVLFVRMQKIRRECRQTLAKRYSSGDIICHDNMANYLGMESFKGKQTRGNGVLVLAQRELYFLRLLPRMELCIPLKRIKRVMTPSSFLGKSVLKPLLKVDFHDEDGILNSVAWHIKDMDTFKNSLRLQMKKIGPRKKK